MKKLVFLILTILLLSVVSGCTGVNLISENESASAEPNMKSFEETAFIGESESWTAKLVADYDSMYWEEDGKLEHNGDDHSALYITYKGDASDLDTLKSLRIVCGEDSLESTYKKRHSSTGKTFKMPVNIGEISKDDTIEAIITTDDETQTIELKSSNSREIFEKGNDDYIENHYVFKGESKSWTGEMTADSTIIFFETDGVLGCDSDGASLLTVTYKGDVADLAPVKRFKIAYDTGSGGGSIEEYHDEYPLQEKTFTLSSGSGLTFIEDDFAVKVTITLDGKEESFEMRNQE